MKISIVTSVFQLRKTRPIEFYLMPTNDFLQDMSNSEINIRVHTNLNPNIFTSADNIEIFTDDIDNLINYLWPNKNWRTEYKNSLAGRCPHKFEESVIPELIGIWLGKFEMLYRASLHSDCVLWQDAGILSYLHNRKIEFYQKHKASPHKYKREIEKILQNSSIVLMSSSQTPYFYHGVDMHKYEGYKPSYCRCGFMLLKSNQVPYLRDKMRHYWNLLIANGDYGTEENALTLFKWTLNDIIMFDYNTWISLLGLSSDIKIL